MVRAVRSLPRPLALLALLTLVGAAAPAVGAAGARAPHPSVAACALGTSGPDLRGFFAAELARSEGRFAAQVPGAPAGVRRLFAAGVAAYVYALAPVVHGTVQRFPQNQLVSIAKLVDPAVRTVVLPNHDTTYTVGQLQLAGGPLVLDVPDTAGRYYVIQLLDAYSNTFKYVGRRTTGTRAGSYAIVPPGYRGTLPSVAAHTEPHQPRLGPRSHARQDTPDLPKVADLMRGYRVTALGAWTGGQRQAPLVLPGFPVSPPVPVPTGQTFFARFAEVLRSDPAPAADACALRAFTRAGLVRGPVPGSTAPGLARRALDAAERAGKRVLSLAEQRANRFSARRNNGWLLPGPYVGDYGRNYLGRAVIATGALGANTRPETVYPLALNDSRGRPLDGRHSYRIRFPRGQLPPARAFWSLTMYDETATWCPTRSIATRSATAPPACARAVTGRSRSSSSTARRAARRVRTGCPRRAGASVSQCASTSRARAC